MKDPLSTEQSDEFAPPKSGDGLRAVIKQRDYYVARLGTILNIAEGPPTAKAQQTIARLAREALYG